MGFMRKRSARYVRAARLTFGVTVLAVMVFAVMALTRSAADGAVVIIAGAATVFALAVSGRR